MSPLTSLTTLRHLYLDNNQISDISPLVAMAEKDAQGPKNFAQFWVVSIEGNPLSPVAKSKDLSELKKDAFDVVVSN